MRARKGIIKKKQRRRRGEKKIVARDATYVTKNVFEDNTPE